MRKDKEPKNVLILTVPVIYVVVFEAYPHKGYVGVVRAIKLYLVRTRVILGALTGVFLTTRPEVSVASRDTLCWV